MKRIVYLIDQPFDERNFERFGIQAWIDRQWNVEVWDLTPWAHPRVWQHFMERGHNLKEFHGYFQIKSTGDLQRQVYGAAPVKFFIDLTTETFHSIWAKLALIRMGATRIVCPGGSIPIPERNTHHSAFSRLRRFAAKGPGGAWKWLSNALIAKIVAPRIPVGLTVVSGTQSIALAHPGSDLIKAHNFDYDIYLKLKELPLTSPSDYAVFVDQDYCFHLEFVYQETSSVVTAERYFPAIRSALDAISAALKLDVRIAAHPRASYEQRGAEKFFGAFAIEKGRTADMIRCCKAVICHDSTAIQYAVLFSKPVIFITTDELSLAYEGASIEKVAAELGKKPINIDRVDPRTVDWCGEVKIDLGMYAKYRNKYIKTEDSPDRPLWTIVINRVEQGDRSEAEA